MSEHWAKADLIRACNKAVAEFCPHDDYNEPVFDDAELQDALLNAQSAAAHLRRLLLEAN